MALILMVHNEHFVWSIFVNVQLCKYLIFLNVLTGEADSLGNVTLVVFGLGAKIEQDDLGHDRLGWRSF